jgi:hypothetical protein
VKRTEVVRRLRALAVDLYSWSVHNTRTGLYDLAHEIEVDASDALERIDARLAQLDAAQPTPTVATGPVVRHCDKYHSAYLERCRWLTFSDRKRAHSPYPCDPEYVHPSACAPGRHPHCPGCGTNLCARGCGRNLGPYEECACDLPPYED